MGKNTVAGYFRFRLKAIADGQQLNWTSLAAKTVAVDPDGVGLKPKTVSEHLNIEYCDRVEGRTAFLYCRALECDLSDLYELVGSEGS